MGTVFMYPHLACKISTILKESNLHVWRRFTEFNPHPVKQCYWLTSGFTLLRFSIVFLFSSIRPIEACYEYYKTESFHNFRGEVFQNFFLILVDILNFFC
jgi:hypothetical protein